MVTWSVSKGAATGCCRPAGGNDEIYGDALGLRDHARGGNDLIFAGDEVPYAGESGPLSADSVYGDAYTMQDSTRGGDDILIGGQGRLIDLLYGDAFSMTDNARGGDDWLYGGSNSGRQALEGDAATMSGRARGGDDHLFGGNDLENRNFLYGEGGGLEGDARGGNDTFGGGDRWLRTRSPVMRPPSPAGRVGATTCSSAVSGPVTPSTTTACRAMVRSCPTTPWPATTRW